MFSGGEWDLNILAIVSERGIVVVDAPFSRSIAAEFRRAIAREFGRRDFIYLINTHSCDCHVGGNQAYADATIIGHALLREELTKAESDASHPRSVESMRQRRADNVKYCRKQLDKPELESRARERWMRGRSFFQQALKDLEQGHEIRPPDITFTKRMTLDLGNLTIRLLGFNYTHTKPSLLVFVPEMGLVVEHGIFNKKAIPPISVDDDAPPGLIDGWLAVLDELLDGKVELACVMDVHDKSACGKSSEDLEAFRDYFSRLHKSVLDLNRKGRDLETAKKELSLQGAFSDVRHLLGAEENHPRNIELLWRLADRANARIAQ